MANLSEPETMPTMLTEDVLTLVSDSGYTRYRMTAPLWLMFDEAADPHWTFPQGVTVQQFDEQFRPSASMDCDSATYYSDRKIWEFEGDVVVINTLGDSILTQQLFWDVNDQKIYNDDEFIHIVRQDRIIEGYGFESNQDVTRFKVKRPQLIIPIRNLRRGDTDQQAHAQNLEPVQDTITDMDRRRRHGAPVGHHREPAPGTRRQKRTHHSDLSSQQGFLYVQSPTNTTRTNKQKPSCSPG